MGHADAKYYAIILLWSNDDMWDIDLCRQCLMDYGLCVCVIHLRPRAQNITLYNEFQYYTFKRTTLYSREGELMATI